MAKIYVVIKSGLHELGEMSIATSEAAFSTKEKAEAYMKAHPTVWNEKVNNVNFFCERAIHEVELDGE
jgi:hypothetical protein